MIHSKSRRLALVVTVVAMLMVLGGCEVTYFDGSARDGTWKSSSSHVETTGGALVQDQLYYAYIDVQSFQCYGPSTCPKILAGASSTGFSVTMKHHKVIARSRCGWHLLYRADASIHLTCSRYTP
jgi:hypothetical protein